MALPGYVADNFMGLKGAKGKAPAKKAAMAAKKAAPKKGKGKK